MSHEVALLSTMLLLLLTAAQNDVVQQSAVVTGVIWRETDIYGLFNSELFLLDVGYTE